MAGLQSTYRYDKREMTKANKMLKTGQVPMDVNAMPGLVEDVSAAEELDAESRINALQGGDVCYFCKKPGHQKRHCRKLMNGRGRILTGSTEVTLIRLIPSPQFRVTTGEGERMADMEADKWRIWPNLSQQCRKF